MVLKIYTDGACSGNPGPGGWAVIFQKPNKTDIISGHKLNTTNNQMELHAVIFALDKILKEHDVVNCFINKIEYNIFSDSAYVINAINNCWIEKWKMNDWKTSKGEDVKNKQAWKFLLKLKARCIDNNIKVQFIKVKGHSGNQFNEYADEIAKSEILKCNRED